MKIYSLVSGVAIATVLGFSPLAEAADPDVIAFTCDDCSYTEAKNIIRDRTIPSFHCTSGNPDEIITIGNQVCHSQPVFSAVLNKSTGTLWGFRSSHTNQGGTPMTMQLQVEQHNHNSTIKNMIRDGVQYTEDLSGALQNVASKVSDSFATATAYEQWVNGQSPSMVNVASTTNSSSEFSCTESSEYKAVKAATSGEFKNRLRAEINEAYLDENLQRTDDFDDFQFNGFGLGLQKSGFSVSISWDNELVDKTAFFTFLTPDPLATEDNQEPSVVAFKLSPISNGISISLDATKTHISGNYWSVMTDSSVTSLEVSPCAAEALEDAFGTPTTSGPSGGGGGGNYIPPSNGGGTSLPGVGGGGGDGWDSQVCDKHYYDSEGNKVITIKVMC